jgi:hypothetical protein
MMSSQSTGSPEVTPWPKAADLLPINRVLLAFWLTKGGDSGEGMHMSRVRVSSLQ